MIHLISLIEREDLTEDSFESAFFGVVLHHLVQNEYAISVFTLLFVCEVFVHRTAKQVSSTFHGVFKGSVTVALPDRPTYLPCLIQTGTHFSLSILDI